MSFILLWLQNQFFKNGLSWVLIGTFLLSIGFIIIPNLDQIRERLGFDTRTSLLKQID